MSGAVVACQHYRTRVVIIHDVLGGGVLKILKGQNAWLGRRGPVVLLG